MLKLINTILNHVKINKLTKRTFELMNKIKQTSVLKMKY